MGCRAVRHRRSRQRGAALLLLLVLLLGAASLLLGAFRPLNRERQREQLTQVRVAEARNALFGYALANGRLPRPASSALDGREASNACSNDADCTGFLPWVALGIAGSDGWGNLLRYSVSPTFTAPITAEVVATKVVLGRGQDGSERYRSGQDQCSNVMLCVSAVVFSTGQYNFGISEQGVAQADRDSNGANADERANAGATQRFMARPSSDDPAAPGGRFDDQLAWIDATVLLSRLHRAGLLH